MANKTNKKNNVSNQVNNLYAFGNTFRCGQEINEDAYFVGKINKYIVLITADGNGTTKGMINPGNMAITLAIDFLNKSLTDKVPIYEVGDILDMTFYTVSRCFLSVNGIDNRYANVYCGMTIAVIDELSCMMVLGNVGNCETYLIRNNHFQLLNAVHSEAFEEFHHNAQGSDWNDEQWHTHMKRGILTSALGVFNNPKADIQQFQLQKDDIVLMMTDGLLHVTTPRGISEVLADYSDNMNTGVNKVIEKASEYECNDNCTLICMYIIDDNGMNLQKVQQNDKINESFKNTFSKMVPNDTSPSNKAYGDNPYDSYQNPYGNYGDNYRDNYRNKNAYKNEYYPENTQNDGNSGGYSEQYAEDVYNPFENLDLNKPKKNWV